VHSASAPLSRCSRPVETFGFSESFYVAQDCSAKVGLCEIRAGHVGAGEGRPHQFARNRFARRRFAPFRLANGSKVRLTSAPARFGQQVGAGKIGAHLPIPGAMFTPMTASLRSRRRDQRRQIRNHLHAGHFCAPEDRHLLDFAPTTTTDSRLARARVAPEKSAPISQRPFRFGAFEIALAQIALTAWCRTDWAA